MSVPLPDGPRVGYVLKVYPRLSETFVVNEILAQEQAGVRVDVFSLRPHPEGPTHELLTDVKACVTYLDSGPLTVDVLRRGESRARRELPGFDRALSAAGDEPLRTFFQAMELAHAVCERGITHLHAHFANLATTVAQLAATMADVPFSFTAHAKDIFHEDVSEQDLREKLAAAAGVVTVSDFNLRHLRSLAQSSAGRVRRVYNGLDLSRHPYSAPDDRPPLIVGVGRLVEKKGFDVLIEACALLSARGTGFRCRIVGGGEREEQLRELITARDLTDRVELVGPRTQDEVQRIVRSGAVLAAPCVVGRDGNRDGLPTVLLEAMAIGTPCVSTPVTGIPELVRHEKTGLLVPERDAAGLATALERLLEDSGLRVRLARAARTLVEENFDISLNAATMREIWTPDAVGLAA